MTQPNPEWLLATLNDVRDALEEAISELENHPHRADTVLEENLANVYAKLNYAVNSAELGPDALNELTDDELVAWPETMPFWLEPSEEDVQH